MPTLAPLSKAVNACGSSGGGPGTPFRNHTPPEDVIDPHIYIDQCINMRDFDNYEIRIMK